MGTIPSSPSSPQILQSRISSTCLLCAWPSAGATAGTTISLGHALAQLAGQWGTYAKQGARGGGQVGTCEWKDSSRTQVGGNWETGDALSQQGVVKWTKVDAGLWGWQS